MTNKMTATKYNYGSAIYSAFDYLLEKYQLNKKIFAYDTFEGMSKPSEIDMDLKNNLASQTKKNYEKNNIIWCYASLDEVKNNYNINLKDITQINNMDTVILAVAHDQYNSIKKEE